MPTYSPEDLILFLYKETSPETTEAIEEALKSDWTLREKLGVLKISMERLNTLVQAPRTEIVLNVLKYGQTKENISSAS